MISKRVLPPSFTFTSSRTLWWRSVSFYRHEANKDRKSKTLSLFYLTGEGSKVIKGK